jgi:hypothetical protein
LAPLNPQAGAALVEIMIRFFDSGVTEVDAQADTSAATTRYLRLFKAILLDLLVSACLSKRIMQNSDQQPRVVHFCAIGVKAATSA